MTDTIVNKEISQGINTLCRGLKLNLKKKVRTASTFQEIKK